MIVCEHLTRYYGGYAAVNNLSVVIPRGAVCGLVGPNGAGKSTLLRMLSTLLPPSFGRAAIGGFDTQDAPADVRRLIGYLPETFHMYDDMTVERYLLFFCILIFESAEMFFRLPLLRRVVAVGSCIFLAILLIVPIAHAGSCYSRWVRLSYHFEEFYAMEKKRLETVERSAEVTYVLETREYYRQRWEKLKKRPQLAIYAGDMDTPEKHAQNMAAYKDAPLKFFFHYHLQAALIYIVLLGTFLTGIVFMRRRAYRRLDREANEAVANSIAENPKEAASTATEASTS